MKQLCSFILICLTLLLISCNVTRSVTTSASSYQNGDTTTTIVTKTIESYNAKKNY